MILNYPKQSRVNAINMMLEKIGLLPIINGDKLDWNKLEEITEKVRVEYNKYIEELPNEKV